mmetsp:Transcript_21082/g.60442  ORF Transcript_21082/g.60442 Transcript_21082/m.60442 type:complete len:93 (-) Transcript_21082:388-666(-)
MFGVAGEETALLGHVEEGRQFLEPLRRLAAGRGGIGRTASSTDMSTGTFILNRRQRINRQKTISTTGTRTAEFESSVPLENSSCDGVCSGAS